MVTADKIIHKNSDGTLTAVDIGVKAENIKGLENALPDYSLGYEDNSPEGAFIVLNGTDGTRSKQVLIGTGATKVEAYGGVIYINSTDTVYEHPESSGNLHIPSGGSEGEVLKWKASGEAKWATLSEDASSNYQIHTCTLSSSSIGEAGVAGIAKTTLSDNGNIKLNDFVISTDDVFYRVNTINSTSVLLLRYIQSIAHGGTGVNSFPLGNVLIGNGNNYITSRGITDNTTRSAVKADNNLITANTLHYHKGNSNISTVGTLSSGTWNANTVETAYGGTGKTSWASNALVYAENSSTLSQLGKGASGQYLKSNGSSAPTWQTLGSSPASGGTTAISSGALYNYTHKTSISGHPSVTVEAGLNTTLTDVFLPAYPGIALVSVTGEFPVSNTGYCLVEINLNGLTKSRCRIPRQTSSNLQGLVNCSLAIEYKSNDLISFTLMQTSGSTQTVEVRYHIAVLRNGQ